MSEDLIQYAFVAGEISPRLIGRTDYEKYDLGLALARNWIVDYRGGLYTRPGMIFGDYVQYPDKNARLVKFNFSSDLANTYAILFGHGYIRFIQDGAYILEAAIAITAITAASPGQVTAVAHGFANGDWVKLSGIVGMTELNGLTVQVAGVTANTFTLQWPDGTTLNTSTFTAYTSGGSVGRIYTISNPYNEADIFALKFYQVRDLIRITHKDYAIRNLVRTAATSWALSVESLAPLATIISGISHTAGAAGTSGAVFKVTWIDANGIESLASDPYLVTNSTNYTTVAGSVRLAWTTVPGAVKYKIYRSRVVDNAAGNLDGGYSVGFLGETNSATFIDSNIIPDFATTPPEYYNPFAPGRITSIELTAVGAGYTSTPTVAVAGGGGSGFVGYAILSQAGGAAGTITGIVIVNPGEGYSSPVVTISGGGGAGATATAEASPLTGSYPRSSTIFQQRQLYSSSINDPLTIWGSRPGQFSNFDNSAILTDADAYEHEVDTETVDPILHMMRMRGGLILMSPSGIWQLTGGSNLSVTPLQAFAEPQTFFGASAVAPFNVDTDILYITYKESTVRLLSYNDYSKLYGGQDMSILSNHFFSNANPIVSWAYTETPNRLAHAVLRDGGMLALTIVREQNVFAWCKLSTRGRIKDVLSLTQDGDDITYMLIERQLGGKTVKTFEWFAPRWDQSIEDQVCLDCALALPVTYPAATITFSAASGTATVTASAAVFSAGNVGDVIRAGFGKAVITAVNLPTSVTVSFKKAITERYPETDNTPPFTSGTWTMDTPVLSIGGLRHFEGETVSILADGSVVPSQVVTNGAITLTVAASRVIVGLPYICIARTLPSVAPNVVIEGKQKRVVGLGIRRYETRGLKIGEKLDHLYEVKDRTTELWGEPIQPKTDIDYETVSGSWNREGQVYLVQENPLPSTLLGLVVDSELGDDKN